MARSRGERAAEWARQTVDRVISIVSPARAAEREYWRRLGDDPVMQSLMRRGYEAASAGSLQGWGLAGGNVTRTSDAELYPALITLRNRSRYLRRNDSLGAAVLRLFTRKVVGTGLTYQSRAEPRERALEMERVHREATRNIDPANGLSYGALQRLRYQKQNEDGECLLVRSVDPDTSQLITETVEADRLGEGPGDVIRQLGIERNAVGAPTGYWIRRGSPGITLKVSADSMQWDLIPANRVYHWHRVERPRTSRGEPLLTPVMQDIRDADLLALAAMKRMQAATCLAGFIESPASAANMPWPVDSKDFGYVLQDPIQPVSMTKLFPGEKMSFLNPNFPMPDIEKLLLIFVKRIGAALGVSWQSIMREWVGSYSAARTQVMEDRPTYAIERQEFVAGLDWETDAIFEDAVMRGEIRAGDDLFDRSLRAWIPDAEDWLDPMADAQSTQLKLEGRLATKRDVVARLGGDWEEVERQAIRERVLSETWEREIREELAPADAEEAEGAPVVVGAAPVAGAPAGAEGVDQVQDTALNGAQVTALLEIVTAVTNDELPAETAAQMILAAFPGFDEATVQKMLGPAESFEPPEPEPVAVPGMPPAAGAAPKAPQPNAAPDDDDSAGREEAA